MNLCPLQIIKEVRNVSNRKDGLFLSCISYEERTVNSFRKFDESYRAERHILFTMKEFEGNQKLRKYGKEIEQILRIRQGEFSHLKVSIADPVSALESFIMLIKKLKLRKAMKSVTIDISTFPRNSLMVLLKYLREIEKGKVRILYTAPEVYATQIGEKMTWGIHRVMPLPFFSGTPISGKQRLLVIFIGFESERALFLWEKHQPNRTILFVGKPAYKESWELMSKYRHQEIIGKNNVTIEEVSTIDFLEAYRKLNKTYLEHRRNYNISIAPLGTKLQLLGIYLHAVEHTDVQLTYATVEGYNTENYSKGIEKLYECQEF